MANEFIARKGLIVPTGSISVSAGSVTANNFFGTASRAVTASFALNGFPSSSVNMDTYTFIGNGSTVDYTLSHSYDASSLLVSMGGLSLTNVLDYTISSSVLSFVSAPATQSNILVKALVNVTQNMTGSFSGSFIGDGSHLVNLPFSGSTNIDTYTFTGNGSTVDYVLSHSYSAISLFVSVDGLTLGNNTDYTLSTNTLSFTEAPVSESNILVKALVNVTHNMTGSFSGSFLGIVASASYVSPSGLPTGTVSSSAQVQLGSISGVTFSNAAFQFPNNVSVEGTLTARELHTKYVSASIIYESGSSKFGNSSDDVMSVTGSIGVLGTLTTTGAATLGSTLVVTGAVTCASITSTAAGSQGTIYDANGNGIVWNTGGANGSYQQWQNAATTYAYVGAEKQIFGSGVANAFAITTSGATGLYFGTNGTRRLTIDSSGAATFSGTLTLSDGSATVTIGSSSGSPNIKHGGTSGRLIIDGDSGGNGGEIILYGSAHASFANQIISNANTHTWKTVSGTTQMTLTSSAATFSGTLTVGGLLTTNANILNLVGGTATITTQSSVNGAGALVITVGKNSTGTARTARMGLNVFADDVWSLDNGTSEYLRINLTTGAATFTGTLAASGYTQTTSSNAEIDPLQVRNTSTGTAAALRILLGNDSASAAGIIGITGSNNTGAGGNVFRIGTSSVSGPVQLITADTARLTIAANGVATFSGQVIVETLLQIISSYGGQNILYLTRGASPSAINIETSGGPNIRLYSDTSNASYVGTDNAYSFGIRTNGTARLTIDSAGVSTFSSNITIGTLSKTWHSSYQTRVIQAGVATAMWGSGTIGATSIGQNFYIPTGGADSFIGTGYANHYYMVDGAHWFRTSTASGVADGTITWNNALIIAAGTGNATFSGTLYVAPASPGNNGIAFTGNNVGIFADSTYLYLGDTVGSNALKITYATGAATFSSTLESLSIISSNRGGSSMSVRLYSAVSGGHQWDIYGHSDGKLRFSDNTGGGGVRVDASTEIYGTLAVTGAVSMTGDVGELSLGNTSSGSYSFMRLYTGSTHKSWQISVQNTLNNGFEIAASTTNGGVSFSTPVFTITSAGAARMSGYGAGTATFDASGNITSVSDERQKTDIVPFTGGLAELRGIVPISHKFSVESGLDTEHTYIGFSAQNVREHLPGVVFEHAVTGTLSLWDRGMLAVTVNAVKSLEEQLADALARIAVLESTP